MKLKYILCLILVMSLFLNFGCTEQIKNENNTSLEILTNKTNNEIEKTTEMQSNIDKVEIYHFHGNNQCYSCIKVGDLAEETVNTYFKKELDEGKVVFSHINAQSKENEELVIKYGATGSSLMIGTYKNGELDEVENNIKVWYKIEDKEDYMTYLKGVIETKLTGN
ncbi:thioredoxin family protein [Candidatus Micrarchaeota archaeon]|nr:thioredoxin family protein [Candidatus Micrarchaeota archaeon]